MPKNNLPVGASHQVVVPRKLTGAFIKMDNKNGWRAPVVLHGRCSDKPHLPVILAALRHKILGEEETSPWLPYRYDMILDQQLPCVVLE